MKTFDDINSDLKERFYTNTKIDISKGSVFDMIFKSMSYMLNEAYSEIEANKKPYLFTKQTGDELDSTGAFLQCPI